MKKRLFAFLFLLIFLFSNILHASPLISNQENLESEKFTTALDKSQTEKRNQQLSNKFDQKIYNKINSSLSSFLVNANSTQVKASKKSLEEMDILIPSSHSSSTDFRASGKSESELVNVYIQFKSSADISLADCYIDTIVNRDLETNTLAAWVNLNQLQEIATFDEVLYIDPVLPPIVGSIISDSDHLHNADAFREITGLAGEGIKIGVISDGVNHLKEAQSSGDLSKVNVLSDNTGGDEGTALLEIIYDLAPESELYFHDCGQNTIAFKEAIKSLVDCGCNIIVDDICWPSEPYFEDGSIAQYLKKVMKNSKNGFIYVSAAGNAGLSHHQSIFNGDASGHHDFSAVDGIQLMPVFVPPNGLVQVMLQWDDRFGKSSNDYDLYLFDNQYNVINEDCGVTTQNGSNNPIEFTYYQNNTSETQIVYIDVHQFKGENKTIELYVYGGFVLAYSTSEDAIYGHAALPEVITVGAINVKEFDGTINTDYKIAEYSSKGNVTITFPKTELRPKPDICGFSGVNVSGAGNFPSTFYGTSASAPHIAALTALIWCQSPDKKASQIKKVLFEHAIDLGEPGHDSSYGYGLAYISEKILSQNKPTTLFAIGLDESVIFSWLPNIDSKVSGYEVNYKATYDSEWKNLSCKKHETTLTIEGLENDCEYEFRVRAILNKKYYSAYSDIITATPVKFNPFEQDIPSQPGFPFEWIDL